MSKHSRRNRSTQLVASAMPGGTGSQPVPRSAARPSLTEFGSTGLRSDGGLLAEEYNRDLRGPKWYEAFDKMLRRSAQAQAIELVYSLPLEAVPYRIDPNEQGQAIDREVAEALQTNLFTGMTTTFESAVAEAISGVLMGCNFLLKVWELRDGMVVLKKLAPRHPRNVTNWIQDENGGLQGVEFTTTNPVSRVSQKIIHPMEELLRFAWRERGGNFEGRALFRPLYTDEFIVNKLLLLRNIFGERFGAPTLIGSAPANATESDRQQMLAVMESVRSASRGAIMLPYGYEDPRTLIAAGPRPDLQAWIVHHLQQMARGALVQFLNLGDGSTGSWALSDSQVTVFLMALEQIADWICGIFNRYLIPQWCSYNYPTLNRFPVLAHGPVSHTVQRMGLLELLGKVTSGQLITADQPLEDMVRDLLGLPPADVVGADPDPAPVDESVPQDDESAGASRYSRGRVASGTGVPACDEASSGRAGTAGVPPASGNPPSTSGSGAGGEGSQSAAAARSRQRPRDHAHWDHTQSRRTAAADQFQERMGAIVKLQLADLRSQVKPILDAIAQADDLSRGKHIQRLMDVKVTATGKYQTALTDWLRTFYTESVAAAAKAAGRAVPATMPNAVRSWLNTYAAILAAKHGDAVRARVQLETLPALRKQIPTGKLLWNLEQQARKKASLDITDDLVAAGAELTDMLNDSLHDLPLEDPKPEDEA